MSSPELWEYDLLCITCSKGNSSFPGEGYFTDIVEASIGISPWKLLFHKLAQSTC